MAVVTVSLLTASGGNEIARIAADQLGYNIVDAGLIRRIAERAGVAIERVRDYDERTQSRAVELLNHVISPPVSRILAADIDQIDSKMFLEYSRTIILGLAKEGNMVIVGRGAQFILKDWPDAVHVRIIADEQFRINRLREKENVSESIARETVRKRDACRKRYHERFFNDNAEDPFHYHMVFNTGKIGLDIAAALIADAVQRFDMKRERKPDFKEPRNEERRSGNELRDPERRIDPDDVPESKKENLAGPSKRTSAADRRVGDRRAGADRRNHPERND